MSTYSVREVAMLLNTSEETVRRWIREKKLDAVYESKKAGNVITEETLIAFSENNPKYSMAIKKSLSGFGEFVKGYNEILGSQIANLTPSLEILASVLSKLDFTKYKMELMEEIANKNNQLEEVATKQMALMEQIACLEKELQSNMMEITFLKKQIEEKEHLLKRIEVHEEERKNNNESTNE